MNDVKSGNLINYGYWGEELPIEFLKSKEYKIFYEWCKTHQYVPPNGIALFRGPDPWPEPIN